MSPPAHRAERGVEAIAMAHGMRSYAMLGTTWAGEGVVGITPEDESLGRDRVQAERQAAGGASDLTGLVGYV